VARRVGASVLRAVFCGGARCVVECAATVRLCVAAGGRADEALGTVCCTGRETAWLTARWREAGSREGRVACAVLAAVRFLVDGRAACVVPATVRRPAEDCRSACALVVVGRVSAAELVVRRAWLLVSILRRVVARLAVDCVAVCRARNASGRAAAMVAGRP